MSNKLKRKTLKLCHPNPLFEKWLEEWKNEAASRNSDTQYAFAKVGLFLVLFNMMKNIIDWNLGPQI